MIHEYSILYNNILLVPLSDVDSEQYRNLRNRIENRQWFLFSESITKEKQKEWYKKYLLTEGDYMFSILNENKEYMGGCAIYNLDNSNQCAEFGRIIVDNKKRMAGIGFQATMGACKLAKEMLQIKKLYLNVFSDNYEAIHMYLKAGFLETGTTRLRNRDIIIMEKYLLD